MKFGLMKLFVAVITFSSIIIAQQCYAGGYGEALGRAIIEGMKQSDDIDTQLNGKELEDDYNKLQEQKLCRDKCIRNFQLSIPPGRTMSCQNDARCRLCFNTCQ